MSSLQNFPANINSLENFPVEQLWYTWSDVGLSAVSAGFRVRAATKDLTEIYGERVKSMDRYMRYALPPGTNPLTVTPNTAPIGFAFVRTEKGESILVHKNYVGKDGVGRPGNFFVHLLAFGERSSHVSAEDAIWFWDAGFWISKDELDRRSTSLNPVWYNDLGAQTKDIPVRALATIPHYEQALNFLLQVYLNQRAGARLPIYLAAPAEHAHAIAYTIAGLTYCIPELLRPGLTFSTYEPDITKATTEIIGTSWLQGQDASQVIPPRWEAQHLLFNYATGNATPLQNHPQVAFNPQVAQFAAYITESLLTSSNQEEIAQLRKYAAETPTLSLETFLKKFTTIIASKQSSDRQKLVEKLRGADTMLTFLNTPADRKSILKEAASDPQWSKQELKPIFTILRERAERESNAGTGRQMQPAYVVVDSEYDLTWANFESPYKRAQKSNARNQTRISLQPLAEVLPLLAQDAIPETTRLLESKGKVTSKKVEQINTLVDLMNTCLPSQKANAVWKQLFDTISVPTAAFPVLKSQWELHDLLLHAWSEALPATPDYDTRIEPLLTIPWPRFGPFLHRCLRGPHTQWALLAAQNLLSEAVPAPTIQNFRELKQVYPQETSTLLSAALQEGKVPLAYTFFTRLIQDDAFIPQQMNAFLDQLLSTLKSDSRNFSFASELISTLARRNYIGSASYVQTAAAFLYELFVGDQQAGVRLLQQLFASGSSQLQPLIEGMVRNLQRDAHASLSTRKELVTLLLRNGYRGGADFESTVKGLLTELLTSDVREGSAFLSLLLASNYEKNALSEIVMDTAGILKDVDLVDVLSLIYATPDTLSQFFLQEGSRYLASTRHFRCMLIVYQKLLQLLPHVHKLERLAVVLDAPLEAHTKVQVLQNTPLVVAERVKVIEVYGQSFLKETNGLASLVVDWFTELAQRNSGVSLSQLFFRIFTPSGDYIHLEELLKQARLSLDEGLQLFKTRTDGTDFFIESPTAHELFAGIAQRANKVASMAGSQRSAEKLDVLTLWLNALIETPPGNNPTSRKKWKQEVSALLEEACLTLPEQRQFLNQYADALLSITASLPHLKGYIVSYIEHFTVDGLEDPQDQALLVTLAQYQQNLPVDENTQKHIQYWKLLGEYLSTPNMHPTVLRNLAIVLEQLSLPRTARFTRILAQSFITCIQATADLENILQYPMKVANIQHSGTNFLYMLVEEVAVRNKQEPALHRLTPYIVFALTLQNVSYPDHFTKVYLDYLLDGVEDVRIWKKIHADVQQQGLSEEAWERWTGYLNHLKILEELTDEKQNGFVKVFDDMKAFPPKMPLPQIFQKGNTTHQNPGPQIPQEGSNTQKPPKTQKRQKGNKAQQQPGSHR